MQAVYDALNWVDGNILWGIPMIALIIAVGIFLTIRSKFFQVRKLGLSIKHTVGGSIKAMKNNQKTDDPNAISPFEAFSTAVSGTVGTGNIVGVTTAIVSGGPGAVFWMWISSFFGMFTKFSEITLGLYYRKKNSKGEFIGGPMLYIENGAKCKWLAVMFAVFTLLASIGIGSVQADTIQKTWNEAFSVPIWVSAIVIVVLAALVLLGGLKRIGRVASLIVPFMIIFFLVMAIILVLVHITAVPAAFASIFTSAFSTESMLGGFLGYGIATAMRYGFARGVFSNEAGLGSAPIAHSTSATKEPVEQGFWGIFEVFIVSFGVCTLTALLVLTSGVDGNAIGDGAKVAMHAFSDTFGLFGRISYSIILPLFAFSTLLTWGLYGAKATEYLFEKKQKGAVTVFNIIYLVIIFGIAMLTLFCGENLGSDFVWLLADMTNALMALPNLIALALLSGMVIKITKNYFDRKKGLPVAPMITAYDDSGFIKKEEK